MESVHRESGVYSRYTISRRGPHFHFLRLRVQWWHHQWSRSGGPAACHKRGKSRDPRAHRLRRVTDARVLNHLHPRPSLSPSPHIAHRHVRSQARRGSNPQKTPRRYASDCAQVWLISSVTPAIKELVTDANFQCGEEGIVRAPRHFVSDVRALIACGDFRPCRRWTTHTSRSSPSSLSERDSPNTVATGRSRWVSISLPSPRS